MSTLYLRSRMEERAGLSDLATNLLDTLAKDHKEPSNEQRSQLELWGAKVKDLDSEIAQLEAMVNGNAKFANIISRVSGVEEQEERREADRRDRVETRERPKSFGQKFVESEEFKQYSGRGTMPPVEFENFLEKRAAITTGDLDIPPYLWDGPRGYVTTTPLLNAIGREVVSSGSVEFITWGSADPKAAVVAEGEVKPEAAITPTTTPLSLETYAHWKAITRQALEDYPRIQSIVETKLRGGLASALEAAAAAVIGAASFPPATGPTLSEGIRNGIGIVQAAGYQPNAVLLNPADYAALDITASAEGNNGPVSYGSFWGVQPIAVGALPVGTAYVGDFKEAVTWFDRNTTAVFMTDSHSDYFVRNLLVILAEQRSAFAATELNAASEITVTPPAGGVTRSSSSK